jgi:Mycobacterium membrane protein
MSQPEGDRIARASKGQRVKGIPIASRVKRGWMLLVAVLVVAITGFAIYRLHGIFGSHNSTSANSGLANEIVPFNPKQVVLEVFGAPGTMATINYLDVNAQPQQVKDAPLPWTYTITTTEPAVVGNVVAQGDGDTIGCRITVNGEVKDERTVNKFHAYTYCLDKSG